MEHVDTVIIGAGAIGLAIAQRLAAVGREVAVLERHDAFGRETSSRNSEVIHAGFYYPEWSLKARLCVEGNPLLYEFCRLHDVPHKRCGKLVVARGGEDEKKISALLYQGKKNGVPGLELIDRRRMKELEPAIEGTAALFAPSTGIFDTHTFMKRLEQLTEAAGGLVAYNCEVKRIVPSVSGCEVHATDADGSAIALECGHVVNCAGLFADRVAASAGIDVDEAGYRIHYCKGEYFSVSPRHRGKLSHLVYPAPTPISLGVHGVLGLNGSLKLGPNAFYVDDMDYTVDPAHASGFFRDAKALFPFLEENDLAPDQAGIRPKLQAQGEQFHDWVIRDEAERGMPGLINLIGLESPALTSSLAIARLVQTLIAG